MKQEVRACREYLRRLRASGVRRVGETPYENIARSLPFRWTSVKLDGYYSKLKKFVNEVCTQTADIAAGKILPERRSVTGDFSEGEEAQELACAHKEV